MSAAFSSLIPLVVFGVVIGVVVLLFWAGYVLSTKITKSVGLQVFLTIVFGLVFNIGLVTATVAGCLAITGTPNFH